MATDQFTVKGSIVFNTAGFEKAMTRASKRLRTFGNQASRVGREITTTISAPMALLAGAAIKVATEFELAQRKIQALNPKGNIDKLTKSARELGASTIFTASEVSDLQLSLAKLGKSDVEIQNLQGTILKFAQAMDQDLATSGEFLVKTMNRFADSLENVGGQQEQAAYVGNLFASVAANTALNAQNLGNALNYVGSEAAVYGLTLEDTAAILGLLADRGFDASRGGTALRRILAQLGKDGYTASEAIEQLLDPTRGFSAELEQFGLRGAGPAAALGGLRDEFEELRDTISNSNGFLNEFALVLDNSLAASFKRVKSAAQEVGIAFTTEFGDTIRIITANLTRLLRGFADLPKPIKRVIVGLGAFLAIAGPLLAVVGALSLAVSGLLLLNPVGLAISAFGIVAAGAAGSIALLTENTDAASLSMDDLRRKAYASNDALKEVAKAELVSREELEKIVKFQFEIERLQGKLFKLQRSNVGSSYNTQIANLTTEIQQLKDAQSDYADQVERAARARKEERQEAEKFAKDMGAAFFGFLPGQGGSQGGSSEEVETRTVNDLLQQRREILSRIEAAKTEALSSGKSGLFDPDNLKSLNEELKGIETLLKLVGIEFDKTGKKADKPWPGNLAKEFFKLNPEIAEIDDLSNRYAASIAELERIHANLTTRINDQVQATGKASDADMQSLQANEALTKAFKDRLEAVGDLNDAFFAPQLSEGFVEMMGSDIDQFLEDFYQRVSDIQSISLDIGNTFANAISTSIQAAVEGTESFAKAIKGSLISAIQALLTKLAALAIAWGIIALLVTIASAGSNIGAAAGAIKDAGFVNFALGNSGLGGFTRSAQGGGGLRTQGYLSGSDIVLGTRRGATALDRIYG